MDFGFGNGGDNGAAQTPPPGIEPKEPKTDLGGDGGNGGEPTNLPPSPPGGGEPNNPPVPPVPPTEVKFEHDLTAGTSLEFEGQTYSVNENGDIIDAEGNVFKANADVKAWLEGLDVDNTNDEPQMNFEAIHSAIGVDIQGEDGQPVTYEDTPEGIASYVQDVIKAGEEEHYQTALNTLFTKYPILEDVLNYYTANGNSLDGYGEMKDRSSIVLDESNEEQQVSIIKSAWKEQGRRGDVDAYIDYLKSSGTLKDVAAAELQGLKDSDAAAKQALAEQARAKEEAHQQEIAAYWQGVQNVIKERKIAGYEIPENILITKNGQKVSATPTDFFNYLYRVDKDGKSAYTHDLEKETPESRRDDEILRAYLKFTGGNYSNLIEMAINEEKIKKLRIASKNNNKPKVTITKPTGKTGDGLEFGY